MSAQSYYRERLGFDQGEMVDADQHYEESLSKFKDEREAIQKKTFTKWVNKHLAKTGKRAVDLFEDLRDGTLLVSLLEVLAGEHLPRERGRMRFHNLQNVQTVLDFLKYRKIKLVNIRAEDIVDGNPKLILGLIWTIILHFQISDIVVGLEDNITAKDALLRWAQKSTSKYPGVKVDNFTKSWRDGLAFNAIIHRNRPDLVDWKNIQRRNAKERLESAFNLAERDFGVTRLLDPEDVDTERPDEKSLITYISSLYDAFPDPPRAHPLFGDTGSQKKGEEYRDTASSLYAWIRENLNKMNDRHFSSSLIEMRRMAGDMNRFRVEEIPPRTQAKQRLQHLARDVEKNFRDGEIDRELSLENIERNWQTLMMAHQDKDQAIHDEIKKLEKLQRLAEKIHRDAKQTEIRLGEIEQRIEEEAKRINRLHPLDAKNNCDHLERDLQLTEETIKSMFNDAQVLHDARFSQAPELHRMVQHLHQRWISIRTMLHNRLLSVLASISFPIEEKTVTRMSKTVMETRLVETDVHFRHVLETSEWIRNKQKQLEDADFGSDLPSVQAELEKQNKEHRVIEKFQSSVDKCAQAKSNFRGEELQLYINYLNTVQKSYSELHISSRKRYSDLETLMDFVQSATNELIWLSEKEEREITRDWSSKNLSLVEIEQYYEVLMSELEKREIQFNAVQDRGESLVLQHHPASKCVETYMSAMQTQWAWLLQLTLCLETHLKYVSTYQQYFSDVRECEQTIARKEEVLNSVFSKSDFSLDEGEVLLKDMQDIRDELTKYGDFVEGLTSQSREIIPLKQRKTNISRPINVTAICSYKQNNQQMVINKDERCILHDNSQKIRWKVTNSSGLEGLVPGVCFLIPPPDKEALDSVERLRKQYDRVVTLWQKKQLKMRQNMIFATIRVVKSWDLSQFLAMGAEQRNAIRKALNEDAEKLFQEGDNNDPALRRLRREIDDVNKLFDEFERKALEAEKTKSTSKQFSEQITVLHSDLEDVERTLMSRVNATLPRDLTVLTRMVVEHEEFEYTYTQIQSRVQTIQRSYATLPQKTTALQAKMETLVEKWERVSTLSSLYVERLKVIEVVLSNLDKTTNMVSQIEQKVSSYDSMPTDDDTLKRASSDLFSLQNTVQVHQSRVDSLTDDVKIVKRNVEKSRGSQKRHVDVEKLEDDVHRTTTRWNNASSQVVNRLRFVEETSELTTRDNIYQQEMNWVDSSNQRSMAVTESKSRASGNMTLYNSVIEEKITIEQVNTESARLAKERREKIEKQYTETVETMDNLLDWLNEIEKRLAMQENVRETWEEVQKQLTIVRTIREDIQRHSEQMNSCIDSMRQLVSTGGEVISAEKLAMLQKTGTQLKTRFDRSSDHSEKLLRKLKIASDELKKYKTEATTFKSWMEKSIRILEDKERNVGNLGTSGREQTKAFVSDVIAHQGDLRFITMSAQKFLDTSREYLQHLNEYRTNLPQRLPFLETRESLVRQEVQEVTTTYQDLLARANKLFDRLSNLGNRQKEFQDALDKAIAWLKEISPRVQKVLSEPVAGEPRLIEEQLSRAKALQNEILSQGRIISNVRQATNNLLNSMEELSPSERAEIEGAASGLEKRYQELIDAMNVKVKDLDSALAQAQDVQDAVDGVANWIGQAENQLRIIMKPASLIRERLDEQIREVKILQADIDSHRPSIENMARAADDLLHSGGGRISKKVEGKLKDVLSRYENLVQKLVDRSVNLNEVSTQLDSFNYTVSHFEQWFTEMFDIIDTKLTGDNAQSVLDEVIRRKDSKSRDFDEMITAGKTLVSRKDVTDTTPAKEKIKTLENQWKDLNATLDEKNRLGRARLEHLNAYEKLRDQVNSWLTSMESRISSLRTVAVDIDLLRQQTDELKPITKEYRDYNITIDKVNDLGNAYDAMIRTDSAKRRSGSASSPIRRTSSSFRASEPRSPSPSKSGIGLGRRISQEGGYVNLEDASPVQAQLNEINNRYSLIGMKLSDRQTDIDAMKEEIKKITENLKALVVFLDKEERLLPKDTIPQSREEADKLLKTIQRILEDLYEKQGLLDNTRSQVTDLLRRKPDAPGGDELQRSFQEISQRWKNLQDICKQRIGFLENVKEFYDSHHNLSNWLSAKDKMLGVLGPIAAEPGMVQNQLEQVRVIRDEFRAQKPILDSFNTSGDNLLVQVSPNTPDGRKIEDKLASINQMWNDLLHKLDTREGNLDAASGASSDFYNNLNKLQDNLHKISDDLDDLVQDKGKVDPDELLKRLNALDKALENQRPVLADVEASGLQLCDILNDPISKADIQKKLSQVARLFAQCQKKLDNCKAELENSKKDAMEFENACEAANEWIQDLLSQFTDKLVVSADRDILRQQIDEFEPIYKEVMQKEHEIIMTINKGKELASARNTRKNDQRLVQQNIDRIQKGWDRLKKETLDRHSRLQSCMELCRKYDRQLETFVPWLSQVEDRLARIKLETLTKTELDKLIKELNTVKSDIWRHAGEYESCRAQGETFLAACDRDKEGVKEELQDLKERWDALNAEILAKAKELEDAAQRLAEFNENARDVKNALSRCEDRLASADDTKDPKVLQKIRAIVEEAQKLEKPVIGVKTKGDGLCKTATQQGCDFADIQETVEDLVDKYDTLRAKLDARGADIEAIQKALAQFAEKMKALGLELGNLGDELSGMKPIGRDIPTVKSQLKEIQAFMNKLQNKSGDIDNAAAFAEDLKRKGFVADTKEMKDQIENLRKQLSRLDTRGRQREDELEKTLAKLEAFYDHYNGVNEEINDLVQQERNFSKSIGGDVDAIRAQQAQFKEFKLRHIDAVGKEVDKCNKTGQGLIQSAANGVSTSGIEKDLEKLNDKWNSLKERINEQERKLDLALLQSGKFAEALDGLNKWLRDIEEMVANQKPPSADSKVVKAQLQEQKFLNKMLVDREPSVTSLFKMGKEIAANADPTERAHIESQLGDLGDRYENLCDGAKVRQKALEDAMKVAKEFQDKLGPISEWLDLMSKKLKDMSLIPSDEDKIQKRIKEHDALHDNILKKQPDFNDLADIAAALMELVGDEEATVVADKLQELTDRYSKLVEDSEALRNLLKLSKGALRHLVLSYEELIRWMDDMDGRLNKHKVISVHKEKLMEQMDRLADLTEEIRDHEKQVFETVDSGLELMKYISSDEAIRLKDKLDSLQRRFTDSSNKAANLLKNAHEALPLVTQFHDNHKSLSDWMADAEGVLSKLDNANMAEQEKEIGRLGREIPEERKILEVINLLGAQLCQLSPGEGASTIEGLVTRDNRRFEAICEQVQRRAERIQMSKLRSMEVLGDIDDLLDWFREIEGQIKNAEKPSCEPQVVRVQLQEHRALNDEISSQKGRVRDVLAMAKKVLREASQGEDTATLREKADDLKETMELVCNLSSERLNALESALPLAEHFVETHNVLANWMDIMEDEMSVFDVPAIRPDQIMKLQDKTQAFLQSINEHKPLIDKLNKTGAALMKLCNNDDANKVDEVMQNDNERYNALKAHLREQQQALEKALQETSLFKDKLDGMLNALENTADQCKNAEPISAHPEKIRDQIDENQAIIDDVKKREEAFNSVTKAANDVINKAVNKNDPSIKEIKQKLDRLNSLWDQIQKATKTRGKNLDEALVLAEKFWAELHAIMEKLDALQDTLKNQEPVAVEPKAIQKQQNDLLEIKKDIEKTKPDVVRCRQSGQNLMKICGDQDKPEIKKNLTDMDGAWDNITALFAKREENLIDAMEKAMEFHETLQELLKFLDKAEKRLISFDIIGADIDSVKKQIKELKDFKSDVDPMMVKVESLNRQAYELTERTDQSQAGKIKGPLAEVNRRWDELLKGIVARHRNLEDALLRLGQFEHALKELMAWIEKTNKSLENLKPVFGDPQVIEVELAKLKVLVNDIQSHQKSVDTLNDAGRQIIESEKDSVKSSQTQGKLNDLNKKWEELQRKALARQQELEDALRDAQAFNAEIQDLLFWLNDVDAALSSSKPVGGLPETASEQLARFMDIFNELEMNRPKVEAVLQQGQEYLKKSAEGAPNLANNLKTLKQRWDSVMNRANDKKIKLEIALKEANEFHKAVQDFIDWLTEAERYLTGLEPVSRVLDKVILQVDSHKEFQKEVTAHREVMLNLEKKGNHLKYFSQKQDVILIKNLLISVQHRWDRVVSKSTERTRGLDLGFKEAKEFHDSFHSLYKWLEDADQSLDEIIATAANNPVKIKQMLAKHKEFQRTLAAKQPAYDSTMRIGKALKDKAPKPDEPVLRQMMTDLKNKWNSVCNKSVEKQRALEEALLRSGQFKDALQELLDWLKHVDGLLVADGPVHGDLDTVTALIEQHRKIEEQLENRRSQMNNLVKTAEEIMETAGAEEKTKLASQVKEIKTSFDKIKGKCDHKSRRLEEALRDAEKLHKSVHLLLEWFTDAERRLRQQSTLPDDEAGTRKLLEEQEKFMRELLSKEREKDDTLALAKEILSKAHPDAVNTIKHWIQIIQSRWDEISSWANQRLQKLQANLASLRDMEELLAELMAWLQKCEDQLTRQEQEPLPDDFQEIQILVKEHREFMEGMARRQPEIDSVCKPKLPAWQPAGKGKQGPAGRLRSITPGGDSREGSPDLDFAQRRLSPGREKTPDMFPHIGPRFDRRGSKAFEPQIKNPQVKALWDKWKHVWMMAWERQRRLMDKHNYLMELEKVKNFSWEDWRKRFLKFNNHKKSRVTDIFRRIDRNNNGLIPREEFIDAIMKTKFPTSRLEMNAVADMFDHGDGLIDYMEFIAALRPDWEEKKPAPIERDAIDDEIQRQVMKCTCRQKFRVLQVGEGKYRFGESQKLRLVRILRSTVMVRVGGGWVALDEFLVKNDPCRAKGRTNIELREQFILADGVSQTMTAFKSKPSTSTISSGNRSVQSLPTQGPITKVKERSIRSVPMGIRARSTERSTPDSTFSDDGFKSSRLPVRGRSGGASRGSQPGSRSGSKPPSRAGSNVSLDSTDEGSRIPIRRTGSLKRGSPAPSGLRTPLASSTPRTPFSLNTKLNGSSVARGRSPSGAAGDRTRTPSGSSVSFNLHGSGSGAGTVAAGSTSTSTFATSASSATSASATQGGTTVSRTSNLSRKSSGSTEFSAKKSFSRTTE